MATGYGVPVRFTKEKNVWDLFVTLNVGSGGALNIAQSINGQYICKGIANVWQSTPTFTGVTSSGSATINSVSSFQGVYPGMALVSSGNVAAGATVGTITAATGSIVINGSSAAGFTGSTGAAMTVSGGQYIFQFGVLTNINGSNTSTSRLDTYNRLLDFNVSYDGATSSAIGTATQVSTIPNASQYFLVQNNITQKTIPQTATSGSTDAAVVHQFGNSGGTLGNGFTPAVLAPGTAIRVNFSFGNTTSP